MITTRAPITAYATPEESALAIAAIATSIAGARTRIRVLMYSFTHPQLVEALIAASARGVDVRVLIDRSSATNIYGAGAYGRLLAALGPQRCFTGTAPTGEIMHRKTMAVDGRLVCDGSLNWSRSGPVEENSLLVITSTRLAADIESQFEALVAWNLAHPPPPPPAPPTKGPGV